MPPRFAKTLQGLPNQFAAGRGQDAVQDASLRKGQLYIPWLPECPTCSQMFPLGSRIGREICQHGLRGERDEENRREGNPEVQGGGGMQQKMLRNKANNALLDQARHKKKHISTSLSLSLFLSVSLSLSLSLYISAFIS